MAKPEDNQYRLELFRAFAKADSETRVELRADIQHQRRLDILFIVFEAATVCFGAALAAGVLTLAFVLGFHDHGTAAAWTAVGDVGAVAGYLVRRSFFLTPPKAVGASKGDDDKDDGHDQDSGPTQLPAGDE